VLEYEKAPSTSVLGAFNITIYSIQYNPSFINN